MTDDKKQMLTADSRFVVSFLLEESLHQGAETAPARPHFAPAQAELDRYRKKYAAISPAAGNAFMAAAETVIPHVTGDEFHQWTGFGTTLLQVAPLGEALMQAFFDASAPVFDRTSFTYLKAWMEKGRSMARISTRTAVTYYSLTPVFIKLSNNIQLQKWGDWCTHLLDRQDADDPLGETFLHHSIQCLEVMTFREFREYKNLGFRFLRLAPDLGRRFFAKVTPGLAALDITQRRTLYHLARRISQEDPEHAFAFFQTAPEKVAAVFPNERNRLLDIVEQVARSAPEKTDTVFSSLVAAVKNAPYPRQIVILDACKTVAAASAEAGQAFIASLPRTLSRLPDGFISQYVDKGLLHADDAPAFFSLATPAARRELARWEQAVFLEDHARTLSVLATAMCGSPVDISDDRDLAGLLGSHQELYPTISGRTLYLPWFMADADDEHKNFQHYKITTAHLAGMKEFNTFTADLPVMLKMLSDLPQAALALDIFFILEHGRIDFHIARTYSGLKNTIEEMIWQAVNQRPLPEALPLQEAVIEVLLLYSLVPFNPDYARSFKTPSRFLSPHIAFLNQTLTGFYENNNSVWTCFEKTYDIYHYLKALPNHRDGHAETPYRPTLPMAFRGTIYPAMIQVVPAVRAPLIQTDSAAAADFPEDGVGLALSPNIPDHLVVREGDRQTGPGIIFQGNMPGAPQAGAGDTAGDAVDQPTLSSDATVLRADGARYYDEWDHTLQAFRKKWCRLSELPAPTGDLDCISAIYRQHRELIRKVRHHFSQIKPNTFETLSRVNWGDELDLSAVIEHVVDKKTGHVPSDDIFIRKERKKQDLSILFLVDMSASTGNAAAPGNIDGDHKTIIDVEMESLVIVSEAIEALAHGWAIYGFSGYGRNNVEVYPIKNFPEPYRDKVKSRIAGMQSRKSTRMGTAIRHVTRILDREEAQQRLLILLSDGFPQDYDYGEDRASYEYGIQDTMMALLETKFKGIVPFCITVDHTGKDYLKKICEPGSYLVLNNVFSLPELLPHVVASLIR